MTTKTAAPDTGTLTLSTANGATPAQEFSSLDDFFSAAEPARESVVIAGRLCHFEAPSPEDKDKLIAVHSHDDGEGNTSVENKKWRTNAIAMTWVKSFGGPRVLAKPEDADRFYTQKGFAVIERQMYEVAARVAGLGEGDKEKRRKNSDGGPTTSASPKPA